MATPTIERIEEKIYTPDEFMALPIEHAELIFGEVVTVMPPMFDHGEIAIIIATALRTYVKQNKLGRVSVEASFLIKSEPALVRAPDVCFVSNKTLEGQKTSSYIDGPPTLAVEIISKNDLYSEVDEKAHQFLEAGTKTVWVVNPRRKTVTVLTPNDESKTYNLGQSVPGGEILPDFQLPVVEIFDI